MKILAFTLLLFGANFLFGQSAILLDVSGQKTDIPYKSYAVKAGELSLLDDRGKEITIPATVGSEVLINDRLRFTLLEYAEGKLAKSGLFQQLNKGSLEVFDFGKNGLLARASGSGKLRLIPLSDNKPVLTYLLKGCIETNAESLEANNTNGLNNLLQTIQQYNQCVDPGTAEILFEKKVYASKFRVGPLVGVKLSELSPKNLEFSIREAEGSYVGPVLGLEVRKTIGRSPISLQGQLMISQTIRENDSLPIAFNDFTYEKYKLESLDLQLNVFAAFRLREQGFLNSLKVGISPRYNLNFDLSREVFGPINLTNEVTKAKNVGFGLVGGIGLYEKKLSKGQSLSLQLQVDSYRQYLDFSDGTEASYRIIQWSVLAGYLF